MRQLLSWIIAAALAGPAVAALAADADSSPAAGEQSGWARWQGRLLLGTQATPWRPTFGATTTRLGSVSVYGDYYFSRSLVGPLQLGGFRATSGLIYGPRAGLGAVPVGSAYSIGARQSAPSTAGYAGDVAADPATVPYLGVGYSNLSVRSGWSFSADLGLVAQGAGGTARLGRSLYGSQSLDDAVRELRMTPLVQLGVSYAF